MASLERWELELQGCHQNSPVCPVATHAFTPFTAACKRKWNLCLNSKAWNSCWQLQTTVIISDTSIPNSSEQTSSGFCSLEFFSPSSFQRCFPKLATGFDSCNYCKSYPLHQFPTLLNKHPPASALWNSFPPPPSNAAFRSLQLVLTAATAVIISTTSIPNSSEQTSSGFCSLFGFLVRILLPTLHSEACNWFWQLQLL